MLNLHKIGKLINKIDDLKMECREPLFLSNSDPDDVKKVKEVSEKIAILGKHLAQLEGELISILSE